MSSLNQFAWIANTSIYRFGHNSIPNIRIVDAPADADLSNWAMLHDGSAYRLYAFKRGTTDTLYQASFNGEAYQFGHNSIPVLRLVGFPADADASTFSMLHDGSAYRLYLRRQGDPRTLYQASWVEGTDVYQFGHNSIPAIPVVDFPEDTDWSRWMMLHDGSAYRHYAFKAGSDREFYQGSFDGAAYRFAHNSIPTLTLEGTPPDSNTSRAAMLHDNADYRFYFQTTEVAQPQPEPPTEPPAQPEPPTEPPAQPEPPTEPPAQPEPPTRPPEFSDRGAIVTPILNVSDIGASVRLLEALGWTRRNVYTAEGLVADASDEAGLAAALFATLRFGYGQIFLSLNSQGLRGGNPVGPGSDDYAGANWVYWYMSSPEEVDAIHRRAEKAGIVIVAPPEQKPWGEYEVRIAHPDGHVFRVAAARQPPAEPPAEPPPAPPADAKVVIYEHANYEGRSQELVVGYNAGPLEIGNDVLSSIRVPKGLRVTLYEHGPTVGRTLVLTEDTPWVGDDFNDITSNILVERIEG
jgi:uncharacterized glyoxalase superfamily protein PhnB